MLKYEKLHTKLVSTVQFLKEKIWIWIYMDKELALILKMLSLKKYFGEPIIALILIFFLTCSRKVTLTYHPSRCFFVVVVFLTIRCLNPTPPVEEFPLLPPNHEIPSRDKFQKEYKGYF